MGQQLNLDKGQSMAWCVILWKAIKVRRAFNRLKRAKKNAYREAIGLPPIYPLYERPFRWIWSKIKALLLNTCCRCCKPRPGGLPSSWSKLWTKGTLANEIVKTILGFVVGIIFSKLMLDFMTSQLNFHATVLYWTCILLGFILTFGLTFSDTARCLFILGIPQFFNSKGRAALLAYLMVLALSGPGKNTAMNMEVLTESLVCGQDMVKESTQELVSLATAPWSALKTAVSVIIESLDGVVGRMRNELTGVVNVIYDLINTIKKAYEVLKSIGDMCNSKLGSPFDRCITSFDEASSDCIKELGSTFSWMCSPLDLFRHFCQFAKIPNLVFCWIPSLINQHIFEPLKEHFKTFASSFSKFFDLKPLNFTYDFHHELVQDKTLREIASNMKAEIMGHVSWFLDYVDWMDLVISGFMFLVIWKAFTYRYKFLNSDEFDNFYLSKSMIRMDLRRKRINKASIFPLRYRECKIYVQTFSWALIEKERTHRQLAILFVSIASVQIINYIMIDFLLYNFLELIREYGSIQLDTKDALGFTFAIDGEGFLAEMYRTILRGLSPIGGIMPSFDTSKCLPTAHPPNYLQYALILSLLLVCFIIAAIEPYGLRLRHIICGWIYERRVVQRETWLYQHILSTRDNFLDFAKGQIRARLKGDRSVFQVSCMDRLAHTIPFCKRFFKTHTKKCFLCGRPGELEDFEYFVECPNCHTVYCKECFGDMGQKCLACLKRINYEELSDFSEEFDSDGDSDEDRDLIEICCSRLCSCSSCTKKAMKKSVSKLKSKTAPSNKNKNVRPKDNAHYKNVKYQKLDTTSSGRKSRKVSPRKALRNTSSQPLKKSKSKSKPKSSRSKSPLLKSKSKSKVSSKKKNIGKVASNRSGMLSSLFDSLGAGKTKAISGSKFSKKGVSKKLVTGSSKSPPMKKPVSTKKFKNVKYQPVANKSRNRSKSKSKEPKSKNTNKSTKSMKNETIKNSKRSVNSKSSNAKMKSNTVKSKPKKRRTKSVSPKRKLPTSTNRVHSHSNPPRMSRKTRKTKETRIKSPPSKPRVTDKKIGRTKKTTSRSPKRTKSKRHHTAQKARPTSKSKPKSKPVASVGTQRPKSTSPSSRSKSRKNKKSHSPRRNRSIQTDQQIHEGHEDDDDDSCEQCQLQRAWWNRDPHNVEPFRRPPKKIAPSLQGRVEYLNTFYGQTPYPPHCNL